GVAEAGRDEMDRPTLPPPTEPHGGGPAGVATRAMAVAEEVEPLEDLTEPYLTQQGFRPRPRRGREAAPRAWKHLGLTPPSSSDLFEA
nr:Holliday junction branch migration DNA helicase RuvB [bacterium]